MTRDEQQSTEQRQNTRDDDVFASDTDLGARDDIFASPNDRGENDDALRGLTARRQDAARSRRATAGVEPDPDAPPSSGADFLPRSNAAGGGPPAADLRQTMTDDPGRTSGLSETVRQEMGREDARAGRDADDGAGEAPGESG